MNRKIKLWITLLIGMLAAAPLHADQQSDEQLFTLARTGDLLQLEQLLDQGANPDARNRQGYTPLIMAAYYGHIPLMERLVLRGAQSCAIDGKGSSAMMGAAFRGHFDVIQWLLENSGCDVNHRNHAGQTSLMMAALFGREEIIDLLLKHDADPGIQDSMGNRAATLAAAQGQQAVAEKLN